MLPVTRDIPIPKTIRAVPDMQRKYPFHTLEVGDMFFVPERKKNNLYAHVSVVGRKLGRKFTSKLTYMRKTKTGWVVSEASNKTAVLGIGVWRVE